MGMIERFVLVLFFLLVVLGVYVVFLFDSPYDRCLNTRHGKGHFSDCKTVVQVCTDWFGFLDLDCCERWYDELGVRSVSREVLCGPVPGCDGS